MGEKYRTTIYLFDLNGKIYNISTSVHKDSDSDQKDIDELLSGLTLK